MHVNYMNLIMYIPNLMHGIHSIICSDYDRGPIICTMQTFLLEKGSEPRTGICCRSSPLRNANRNVYGMAFCTFAHGCAFHGLQNIQSSINMDAGLGLVSLAVLDFGYMASAIFTVGMVNSIGTKYSLIVGLVGYLIYVVLCYYPSWYTLIPGGLVAGLTTGPIWIAASCHVIAIVEKMAPVLKERHDVLVGRYIGIIYLAYQLAAIPGNLASSLIFHFSEKYGNSSHDNGTTVDCDLLSTFGVERIYIYILVSFYVFVQVLSILAAFLFLTDASSNPETRLGKVKALVTASTIKKVFNKKMLILAPVGIYNGLQLSISSGIFAQVSPASLICVFDLLRKMHCVLFFFGFFFCLLHVNAYYTAMMGIKNQRMLGTRSFFLCCYN